MAPRSHLPTLLLLALATSCGGTPDAADVDTTVLTGARLIDGTGAAPVENAVLVIRADRLVAAGPAGSVEVPDGARTIDVAGKTIMPPIINLHGHVARALGLENSARFYTEENLRDKLNQYARYGVLHLVSMAGDQPLAYDVRARQREGRFPGARLYTAGRGFGVEGGYPPLQPDEQEGQGAYRLDDPEAARAAVRELAAIPVDFVKMWVDDQFGSVPSLRPEVYAAIIDEAHRNGLRVGAHLYTLADAHGLVDAGVDGLVHSVRDQPVDQALIDKMKAGDVFSVSTLVREESMFIFADRAPYLDDPFFTSHLPEDVVATLASPEYQASRRQGTDVELWKGALRMAQQNLKTLHDAGVRIGLGTDSGPAGRFEGYFEHREMELMVEAGLTPAEVIRIASSGGARILGIDGDYGTIEAGKKAEFLVLGADPLEDISNTKTLEQVWQEGARIF